MSERPNGKNQTEGGQNGVEGKKKFSIMAPEYVQTF
jgi:hypothetical protein